MNNFGEKVSFIWSVADLIRDSFKRLFHHEETNHPQPHPLSPEEELREMNMDVKTPSGARAKFHLRLGPVLVGTLSVDAGRWTFRYADEFRRRPDLRPLPIFPDLDKVYESNELWQFFRMHVPSLKQPSVREIVNREGLDSHDQIQLLKRFGRRTISNPFELVDD